MSNRLYTDSSSAARDARVRLFRIPSAFPTDPLGLDSDNDSSASFDASPSGDNSSSGDGRYRLALGTDNPYFDFRRPGDPGGVGYYKLHSQMLLFDTENTGMSVGFQAVTPAGLEADGIADGPTMLSPNVALFYELTKGTAIQGFVGNHLRANSRWTSGFGRRLQCGLALQSPFPGSEVDDYRSLHLFVEALGRYRYDGNADQRGPVNLELVPGLHWRLGESWWMSGGVLMPLGGPMRYDGRMWQVTASWQF
jgi:hypothetical protein